MRCDLRARVRVIRHEHVHAALHKCGADAAAEGRVDATNDLDLKGAAVSGLAMELGNGGLCVLLVLVGKADDGLRVVGVEGRCGDGSTSLEDSLGQTVADN